MTRPIFLVGMPGAGKTTIGQRISVVLQRTFFDLDEFLEMKTGMSVREIFASQGEQYFRQAEAEALRELTEQTGINVIATGGGAPCFHDNMEFMNEAGTTIYLKVPIEVLVERLSGHGHEHRPLVAGKSSDEIKQFVSETLAARKQFYETAQITYSNITRSHDINELCQLISRLETMC